MRTIADFVGAVRRIRNITEATTFFNDYVDRLRAMSDVPSADAEDIARQNIGWCFGEGMDLETRRMWRTACGAYHPALGTMDREFSFEELLKAGMDVAKKGAAEVRKRFYHTIPTAWERLRRDDDDT